MISRQNNHPISINAQTQAPFAATTTIHPSPFIPTRTGTMSATQAALDNLDDATLETVMALQLMDLADIFYGEDDDDDDDSATSDSVAVAGQAFTEELLQYYAVRRYENEETQLAEASAVAVSGGPTDVQCAACDDYFSAEKVWKAPCGHRYCVQCLEYLHEASMTDETLYPPRCCQSQMPWDDVRGRIDEGLATTFGKKRQELNTPTERRVYCFDADCSAFISTGYIADDVATCPACNKTTCTMCKETARHKGDCPAHDALDQTLTLASDLGWQRCGKCRRVIDLTYGCYHMM